MIIKFIFPLIINEFAWDGTGSLLLITTSEGSILVFDAIKLSKESIGKLEGHSGECFTIAFDPKNNFFATGGTNSIICIWDSKELICTKTFTEIESTIKQVSVSFDGQHIAAASEEDNLFIIDVENLSFLKINTNNYPQLKVSWNPKRNLLAYICEDESKKSDEDLNFHVAFFK